jgi:pyroglutamyl-peptidase
MHPTLLLTTFETWLPHQPSNSSDDLVQELQTLQLLPICCQVLRRLPVDVDLAFQQVLVALDRYDPDGVICCGMAESRPCLSWEQQACQDDLILQTSLDLAALYDRLDLKVTEISQDAGNFVCNGLYYALLNFLTTPAELARSPQRQVLFVHVPLLTPDNQALVMADFLQLLKAWELLWRS